MIVAVVDRKFSEAVSLKLVLVPRRRSGIALRCIFRWLQTSGSTVPGMEPVLLCVAGWIWHLVHIVFLCYSTFFVDIFVTMINFLDSMMNGSMRSVHK